MVDAGQVGHDARRCLCMGHPVIEPLDGVTVIDLTANMTGPYATLILGDQGADVIKVEPPGGEVIRRIGTGKKGLSAYFANLNRSKRSVIVDLQSAAGAAVVRRLAETADVLVQNFRPGVAERLGIGPEEMLAAVPTLVYVSINGFGRSGPLADTPAYDHVVQALSGMAALQEDTKDGRPALVRHGVVDKATGLTTAQAITAALLRRATTGRGAHLEISMLDVALHFLWPDGMMNHTCLDPVDVLPSVARGFRLTQTADGYVSIIAVTDDQWKGLVLAMDLAEQLEDPELQGMEGRMRNGARVMRTVAALIATLPTDAVVKRLRAHDVPCMPVVALADLPRDEQIRATGSLQESDHPVLGRIVQPRPPAQFAGEEPHIPRPAPLPGAETDEVLREKGFSPAEIAHLRAEGVVA